MKTCPEKSVREPCPASSNWQAEPHLSLKSLFYSILQRSAAQAGSPFCTMTAQG